MVVNETACIDSSIDSRRASWTFGNVESSSRPSPNRKLGANSTVKSARLSVVLRRVSNCRRSGAGPPLSSGNVAINASGPTNARLIMAEPLVCMPSMAMAIALDAASLLHRPVLLVLFGSNNCSEKPGQTAVTESIETGCENEIRKTACGTPGFLLGYSAMPTEPMRSSFNNGSLETN